MAGDGVGTFAMPKMAAVDNEGNIYVTDSFMQNFQAFDPEGKVFIYVMGAEKGQTVGRFNAPGGIFAEIRTEFF